MQLRSSFKRTLQEEPPDAQYDRASDTAHFASSTQQQAQKILDTVQTGR